MTEKDPFSKQERRKKIVKYRKQRLSFRDISEKLKDEGFKGASLGQTYTDYQYMLKLGNEREKLTAEDYVKEEVETINDVHQVFYQELEKFAEAEEIKPEEMDLLQLQKALAIRESRFDRAKEAAKILLDCSKERSKLLGNYKPKEIKLSASEALAKMMGVSPEQLPKPEKK